MVIKKQSKKPNTKTNEGSELLNAIKNYPIKVKILNRQRLALWVSIFSVIIALGSFIVVIYKEFLQTYDIAANYSQIIMAKLPEGNRQKIIKDHFVNILLFGDDSEKQNARNNIRLEDLKQFPDFFKAIERKDKDRLNEIFENMKVQNYKLPDEIIKKYIGSQAFSPTFCIPLVISNKGSKFAHISLIYLISRDAKNTKKRWLFKCMTEMNTESIVHRENTTDASRISDIFPGTSVGPKERLNIYPYFFPIWEYENQSIATNSMVPGEYFIHLEGLGPDGEPVFITKTEKLVIKEESLVKMFKGTDMAQYIEHDSFMKEFIK
ncbi:hypothetical protein [Desulfatitalea tepidiphila]|uniref:hypothetical protein n=1 Tax=Desulfatitalea tepidiphila TaxID=1185843 RepID=UPI0006B46845|nr:hypothetical protein [Desulfatitalea tepidiphila]